MLDSAHGAEVAARLAAIEGAFAALLSAAEARIIAHVQGRIVGLDPGLSPAARFAAVERLHAEQVAALAQLRSDIGDEKRQARHDAVAGLSAGRRLRKRALLQRQATERAQLGLPAASMAFVEVIYRRRPRVLRRPLRRRRVKPLPRRTVPPPRR